MLKSLALISLAAAAVPQPTSTPPALGEQISRLIDDVEPSVVTLKEELEVERLRLAQFEREVKRKARLREMEREVRGELRRLRRQLTEAESDANTRMVSSTTQLRQAAGAHRSMFEKAKIEVALATRKLKSSQLDFNEATMDLAPSHAQYQVKQRVVEEAKKAVAAERVPYDEALQNIEVIRSLEDDHRQMARDMSKDVDRIESAIADKEWRLKAIEVDIVEGEERADLAFEIHLREAALARRAAVQAPTPAEPAAALLVQDDFLEARAAAAAAGRPLLLNFTAHVAQNARVMEVVTFKEESVAMELGHFLEARLYLDAKDPAHAASNESRLEAFAGSSAVPFYVVIDPRTGAELGRHAGSTQSPEIFAGLLSESRAAFGGTPEPASDKALWRRIFELEDEVDRLSSDVQAEGVPTSGSR